MKIRGNSKCMCSHQAADHTIGVFLNGHEIVDVEEVLNNEHFGCGICLTSKCKKFTLPNLDYVEYMAEKRGLV